MFFLGALSRFGCLTIAKGFEILELLLVFRGQLKIVYQRAHRYKDVSGNHICQFITYIIAVHGKRRIIKFSIVVSKKLYFLLHKTIP